MKKWIVPLLSLLLIAVLLLITCPFSIFKPSMTKKESEEKPGILFTRGGGKKEQPDPHLILVLKRLREKLDEWLKSINDRIESEEITRLEVRFLEILRSILGWVRGEVDAKIRSSEKEYPQKSEKGSFQESQQRVFSSLPSLLLPPSPSLEMTNGLYAHKGWIAQIEI
jgi:hypothetical protein